MTLLCVAGISEGLCKSRLCPLQKAAVNLLAGKAEVQYNPDTTGPRFLIHCVQDAGFEAQLLRSDR